MNIVIITGANGFIGSALVMRMLKAGVKVYAIDIKFNRCFLPKSPLVDYLETDLNDKVYLSKQLMPAMGCDAFYHLAWRGVNGDEKADPEIQINNMKMALNCAAVAKEIGCKKFLCAGSVAEQIVNCLPNIEICNSGMLYGVAKHCTHLMLKTYCKNIKLPLIWMQFSNIYGIGNNTGNLVGYTLGELMAGREPTFGPAEQPYDFIFVDDLIEAVYRLGEREVLHDCYFIGSGEPRVLKEYLTEIGKLCGMCDAVKIGKRLDDGIRYDFSMFETEVLKHDIGAYVSTSFSKGIEKTINWLKNRK